MVDPNSYEKLNITYMSLIKEYKFKFILGRVVLLSNLSTRQSSMIIMRFVEMRK